MEGRDATSPRGSQQQQQQQTQTGHGPFGAYFQQQRDPGFSLVGNPPSIIHAPTAMRHQMIPTSNPNLNTNPNPNHNLNHNLNSNPNPNSTNSFVPNLNPNANTNNPNPNSLFGGVNNNSDNININNTINNNSSSNTSHSFQGGLMSNLTERSYSEPVKRKRGRPRKYAKDVNGAPSTMNSIPQSPRPVISSSPQRPLLKKKGPVSGKKAQLMALGAAGQNFTPHVLTVSAGEDVSTRIITFTSQGPWAVCILSANGAISNATLRHAGVSGGAVTYEGRFEILSLSGSFLLTESGGTRSRTGGLSVSLSGPDGRVIGGGVAGLLMAASPVQVIIGTFFTDSRTNAASEVVSGIKQPNVMPAGTSPSMQPMQQMRMDGVETMQEQIFGTGAGDGEHQSRVYHVMPLQSIDWGGGHFDTETRDDSEPDSPSPGS